MQFFLELQVAVFGKRGSDGGSISKFGFNMCPTLNLWSVVDTRVLDWSP